MNRLALVLPIIRTDFYKKAVETLYKYTDNFSLILVDQTIDGLPTEWIDKNVHCYIRHRNAGFATASNRGMALALRAGYEYIGVMNDDIEFMYKGWFEDALEEFKTDPKILGINPECPRIGLWGYGRRHDENLDLLPYKENYTAEDITWLKTGNYFEELTKRYEVEPVELPMAEDGKREWGGKIYIPIDRHSTNKPHQAFIEKRGVVDSFAGWLPIFKREGLIELGFYDERFVWGGGEDYDIMCRAYSCAWPIDRTECDEKYHKRLVTTMKSWVWHWWGQSKDKSMELDPRLFEARESWNDFNTLYPTELNEGKPMDVWGHYQDKNGKRKPFRRQKEVYVHPF